MRSLLLTVLAAVCGAVLVVSTTAFGNTPLKIWRTYGELFQRGYVVGYLDAVRLSQRKDMRTFIPAGGKNFDRWLREINAFFDDPANADRTVPDAMGFVGQKIRQEQLDAWTKRSQRGKPSPLPSPGP